VLPYLGLTPLPGEKEFRDFDSAEKEWNGRIVSIAAEDAEARFTVAGAAVNPRVYPCDERGRIVTGFLHGEAALTVALRRFPAGCVRIFVVRRQYGWFAGDPISPVPDLNGRPLVRVVQVGNQGTAMVSLAGRGQIAPGAYQFIARAFRPGWWSAEDDRLRADDVVSDRRFASVVIRITAKLAGWYENGVVLTPEIAGRPLSHRPYFQFLNNFPIATDVYAALDPGALPPNVVTQRAAIYVIQHKSAADWAGSNALTDITGPGMTPAPKIVPIVPGCVNWNETYDVVIDFGNNAADPNLFAADAKLDSPPDMIDGYVRTGFVVMQDPSLPGPYAGAIGRHTYTSGTLVVPHTDTGPNPTDAVPLTAVVRYPAQSSGDDTPCAAGAFPLVVIIHGNSGMETSYLGYNYLLDHLASHGFIAVSVYATVGLMIEGRARVLLQHLAIMAQNNINPGLFQGHLDLTRIGIAGHSRGGETVVRASHINQAEALGWNMRAGVSIAPTDYHHTGDPAIPLVVIYGSNDGDVSGAWPDRTCFDIYDESGRPRSFVFVYGATHDRFNSEWAQAPVEPEIEPGDIPNLISETAHQNIAKGYATAFYRLHLLGNAEQVEYFSASLKPSLVSGVQLHTSHQEPGALVVDNFGQNNPAVNTLGGAIATSNLAAAPSENQLHTLDSFSPHVVTGGEVAWTTTVGQYRTSLPLANKDISAFSALAFRVTQKYGSPHNPANAVQDFDVRLTDRQNRSRAIRVGTFTDLPYPYVRGDAVRIKSAMKTVRIPLISFTITNLGAQNVDLTDIDSIAFEFDAKATGEIEFSDIEFTS
jgi:dienelactone hydrolase